ncbi:MAG: hypothetical protein CMP65_00435 [Flavobacteriales bacterium]|nr:hypothetical protein [Flavobacteriales bacterium]
MRTIALFIIVNICISLHAQKIELVESFIGYTQKSEIISFTKNPKLIMSGNYQGGINLWDLEKQKLIKKIDAHKAPISHITFHESKNTFLSAGKDSIIKLWSFYSNRQIDSVKILFTPTVVLFNNKGNDYFICTEEGSILEKKISKKKPEIISNTKTYINDAFFSSETNQIITCDHNSIKIISTDSGKILDEIKNPYSSHFVKVSPYANDTIISWSENGIISYWDLNNKSKISEIRAKNAYNKLLMNNYSQTILSGYYNDRPLVVNLQELELHQKYSKNMIVVNTFLSSLNQKFLVTADMNDRHRLMKIKEVDLTPLAIQERKISDEKTFKVKSKYIIVNVWDDEKIDGDTLSINYNGKWILKDYHLVKNKKTLLLPLRENQENEIIFHAENLGTEPPNTAAVELEYDNGIRQEFNMRSDFDTNGIVRIIQIKN